MGEQAERRAGAQVALQVVVRRPVAAQAEWVVVTQVAQQVEMPGAQALAVTLVARLVE